MDRGGWNDDDFDEEMRERYEFDVEEETERFVDEPHVCHNVYPDSDSDEKGKYLMQLKRGEGNLFNGQTFFSVVAFKEIMLDCVLKTRRNIKYARYDKNKLSYACNGAGCEWRIYCSTHKNFKKWIVRSYIDKHSCYVNGNFEMVKVPVIAYMFLEKIREEPKYFMPMKIEELMFEKWGVHVFRPQYQAARNRGLKWIERDYDDQFERLRDYKAEIIHSNLDSFVVIESNINTARVKGLSRFYVCFDVLRRSWKETCMPIIGVDACFIKGKMKGQLFIALGRDGNNQIYPLAWTIAQVKNIVNSLWFMKSLKEDLSLGNGYGYIIVSNRKKGLIKVMDVELPRIEHKMYVRHIYANIKSKHGKKTQMKPFIWNFALSYNEVVYIENLRHLMVYDNDVYEYVLNENPRSWCKIFYRWGSCCEDVENSSTQSFKNTIVKTREKPIVPMLNIIARQTIVRIMKRKTLVERHAG